MKVLITGGSGFVGGGLCAAAVERGWDTLAVSRRPSRQGTVLQADLTRPFECEFRPDVVVHAAARSSPWGSRAEFERQNVAATQHIVDFCERRGRPHLVYISTSAVLYRDEHQFNLDESTAPPGRFVNEYARTKYLGEERVRRYSGPSTIVRPRAVFGPGDTVVFPRLLRVARAGRFPILESGTTVMADLIYIDTLVDYLVRVIERKVTGLYHLTQGQPVPVVAFLCDLFARLGLPPPQRRIPVRRAMAIAGLVEGVHRVLPFLGEPPMTRFGVTVFAYSKTLDVSRSLQDLGPPSLSLAAGVDRFIAWQLAQSQ